MQAGPAYLDALDKTQVLTTPVYARVDSASDKAAAAWRIPPSVTAVVSRPRRRIIEVQRKFADKALEAHKAQVDKVIARARGPIAAV